MNPSFQRKLAELRHIEVLPLDTVRQLPPAEPFDAGIYFLWWKDDLMYIGKSANVLERLFRQSEVNKLTHHQFSQTAKCIHFDRHTCLVVERGQVKSQRLDYQLRDLERAYIAAYEPPCNSSEFNGFT